MHACRPLKMARIGDNYYPEGLPKGSSVPVSRSGFVDQEGKQFWICYTQPQLDGHLKRNCGIFCPYMPLFVT